MIKKIFLLLLAFQLCNGMTAQTSWTGTWATAMQPIFDKARIATDLSGHSIRQVLRTSIGGSALRLQLSNAYSDEPLEISSIYIAEAADSCDILPRTVRYLTFGGKRNVTLQAHEECFSDSLPFQVQSLQRLAVTICYVRSPKNPTLHAAPLATTYIVPGISKPKKRFVNAEHAGRWYNIATLEVVSDKSAIVCIGNSITDGAHAHQGCERWTDVMADSLTTWGIPMGVLNLGIGANKVLGPARGEPLVKRFDRDVLQQHGVKSVIILEGVNDIGNTPEGQSEETARQLIQAYKELAKKAHDKGLKIYIKWLLN